MAPVIIVVTPGAIVAITVLVVAVTVLHYAIKRRPASPRPWHGLKRLD